MPTILEQDKMKIFDVGGKGFFNACGWMRIIVTMDSRNRALDKLSQF
jgi:hypothetical protein